MVKPETRHDRAWELAEGSYNKAALIRAVFTKFVERIIQNDDKGVEADDYAKTVETLKQQAQLELDEVLNPSSSQSDLVVHPPAA